jgi:hypothetical protein
MRRILRLAQAERPGDHARHQRRLGGRGELDEPDPVGKRIEEIGGYLDRQARLPGPAQPRERDQPLPIGGD